MTKRDSFIFYRSFYEALKDLPEKERLEVYEAIATFSLEHKEIKLSGVSKTVFTLVKPQLEANYKRYQNGSKPKAKKKQTTSKVEANKNDNVNENVNDNDNIEERKVAFKNALLSQFIDQYDENLLTDFFEYWSESSLGAKKMRYEKEKAFDVGRRLKTWVKNSQRFDKPTLDKGELANKWLNT